MGTWVGSFQPPTFPTGHIHKVMTSDQDSNQTLQSFPQLKLESHAMSLSPQSVGQTSYQVRHSHGEMDPTS